MKKLMRVKYKTGYENISDEEMSTSYITDCVDTENVAYNIWKAS